jgi:hypothetical protein
LNKPVTIFGSPLGEAAFVFAFVFAFVCGFAFDFFIALSPSLSARLLHWRSPKPGIQSRNERNVWSFAVSAAYFDCATM